MGEFQWESGALLPAAIEPRGRGIVSPAGKSKEKKEKRFSG